MLFKHCKLDHNILKGCQTLQLGTLASFTQQTPEFAPWADPNEGTREGTLEGEIVADKLKSTGIASGSGQINFVNCKYSITIPNCYIFCVSKRRDNNGIYSDYDSYFSLPNAQAVANIIGGLLWQQLTLNDLAMSADQRSQLFPSALGITCEHRSVEYFSREDFCITSDNVDVVTSRHSKHPPHFSKFKEYNGKNYEEEQEYRFCFYVIDTYKDQQIAVKKEPKILNISGLAALCSLTA